LNTRGVNEQDTDDYAVNDEPHDDTDYNDTYDEKAAKKSVGRLFDDDENERTTDGNYIATLSDRQTRGDRSRTVPARKIDRPIRSNPEPKPAMKARVPVVREPITARRVERVEETDTTQTTIESDVDNFKARFTSRDAIATASNPGKAESDDRILHPVGTKARSRIAAAPMPDYNSFQSINPIRWVALVGVIVVLVLMIVLAVQNRNLRIERDELMNNPSGQVPPPIVNNGPGTSDVPPTADITELQLQVAELQEDLKLANESIQTLETWASNAGYNVDHIYNPPPEPSPPPTTPDPTPEPTPAPYHVHYVSQGETLSGIARDYYGSGSEENWRRIMEFNEITNPASIQPGQRLRIPRI
jgi:LysM repeat protein